MIIKKLSKNMNKVLYHGLTDAQVLESRAKYGSNVLTPPEEDSFKSYKNINELVNDH